MIVPDKDLLSEEEILATAKSIPAIYRITNLVNGKYYIGSTKDYRIRRTRHLYELRHGKHVNERLQNAWNKYGEENFQFEMITPCTPDELIWMEQCFLEATECYDRHIGYNIKPFASQGGMAPGIFNHTPESKQKIRLANLGQKRSDEARHNMSEAQKRLFASGYVHPNKGKPMSKKRRDVHHVAMCRRRKRVVQMTMQGEDIACFLSVNGAWDVTGVAPHVINKASRGIFRHGGGFKWRYV